MGWPLCVTICVGVISVSAMTAFAFWCAMNAIAGRAASDQDDEDDGNVVDDLADELDRQEKEKEKAEQKQDGSPE